MSGLGAGMTSCDPFVSVSELTDKMDENLLSGLVEGGESFVRISLLDENNESFRLRIAVFRSGPT